MFGPPGTGKSTWPRERFPAALWIDLLSAEAYRSDSARPQRVLEAVAAQSADQTVVIDEVQEVPALLDTVHQLIEQDHQKRRRFVLTGSSARKLRWGAANLLAGRLSVATLHPFLAAELGADFDLRSALNIGLVPLVTMAAMPQEALHAYIALYLREEVQMEGLTRNIGDFSRFLEVMTFSHGAVLNLAQVARERQMGRKAVEGYLNVLEDWLLSFRLPAFALRAKRQRIHHEKFLLFRCRCGSRATPQGTNRWPR